MRCPSNTLRRMAGQLSEGTAAQGGGATAARGFIGWNVGSQLIQLMM